MKFIFYMAFGFSQFCLSETIQSGNVRWIEKSVEVQTENNNESSAKKELIELAVSKASEDLITEIIGEAKYSRNRTLIQNKIIKLNNRYVPFTKPGDLVPFGQGFKLSVSMRISQDDLQTLLLENGLFYESDSTPILLPVIRIVNKLDGRSWSWWQDRGPQKSDLQKISRNIESDLKNSFWKNNFYVIQPQAMHYYQLLPRQEDRLFSFLSSKGDFDWTALSGEWNAQILLQGEVSIAKNPQHAESYLLNIHFVANQVQNGRSIAEIVRQFETEPGPSEVVVDQKLKEILEPVCQDLSAQVLEAWQKGTIGSNLFRLTINGRVPLPLQETLKDLIRNQVREIKNVKDRLISSDQYVLEVDMNLSPKELQFKLPSLHVSGYTMSFDSASELEVVYKWKNESNQNK